MFYLNALVVEYFCMNFWVFPVENEYCKRFISIVRYGWYLHQFCSVYTFAWYRFKWADRIELLLKLFAWLFSADFIKRFGSAYWMNKQHLKSSQRSFGHFSKHGYINFNLSMATNSNDHWNVGWDSIITVHYQAPTAPLKSGNGWVIWSYAL